MKQVDNKIERKQQSFQISKITETKGKNRNEEQREEKLGLANA
jgi:hypothetical protein